MKEWASKDEVAAATKFFLVVGGWTAADMDSESDHLTDGRYPKLPYGKVVGEFATLEEAVAAYEAVPPKAGQYRAITLHDATIGVVQNNAW